MTITATPPAYSSVNDFLVWTCYDANSIDVTKLNYQYIGEVWIGGVKVFSASIYQHPTTNRGIFNFGNVIREYIIAALQSEMGQGVFAIDVICKFKETYLVGVIQTTSASTDDSSRTFFNHYNGRINDFTNLSTYANKPATSRPAIIDIIEGSTTYYLPYFATTTAGISTVINGVSATVTPTVANTIQNINIAAPAATADYTAVIGGVTFNLRIVCENIFTAYTLHFLNQLGGFESMGFNKASKRTFDIERKQWQQLPYRVDGSGVVTVKAGNIMHPQKSMFGVKMNEKLKLSTDLLSNTEHRWLQQLITSLLVYLEDAGTLYPVVITASNYDVKNYDIDGLQQLTIDVEFGSAYKTQFQ